MNQHEPNTEPEATPQEGGLPSTALLCKEENEILRKLLSKQANEIAKYHDNNREKAPSIVLDALCYYMNKLRSVAEKI